MATVHELAGEAYKLFHQKERESGETYWTYDHETAPDWLGALVREAHEGMMPDDWKYGFIVEALGGIYYAGADATETALDDAEYEIEADTYTSDLLRWLASNHNRQSYCNDALHEYGADAEDIMTLIGNGQVQEKREVYRSVLRSLIELAGEFGDVDEDDDEE